MPRKLKKELPPVDLGQETIGEKIAFFRKQQGYTQKELADMIGIERTLVTEYETGRVRLYDEMIARFALSLNVSTDEILGLKQNGDQKKFSPRLKIIRRLHKIEQLSVNKQKNILRTIDALVRDAER